MERDPRPIQRRFILFCFDARMLWDERESWFIGERCYLMSACCSLRRLTEREDARVVRKKVKGRLVAIHPYEVQDVSMQQYVGRKTWLAFRPQEWKVWFAHHCRP